MHNEGTGLSNMAEQDIDVSHIMDQLFFISIDGLTHWSLTGSTMTDEDTFMGFSDGLSQSGTTFISPPILLL